MGGKRIPENPEKPVLPLTTMDEGRCIASAVFYTLRRAEQWERAAEWMARVTGQRLNRRRRLLLAHKYVTIR